LFKIIYLMFAAGCRGGK